MIEIARRAGVTQSTVSRILNKKEDMVSEITRQRVLTIARELKYQPNHYARSLKSGKTQCIGITTLTRTTRFMQLFEQVYLGLTYSGIGEAVSGENYRLIFQDVSRQENIIAMAQNKMVDGLIFITFSEAIEKYEQLRKDYLSSLKVPYVIIHSIERDFGPQSVGLTTARAGFMATEHFIQAHQITEIGCVRPNVPVSHCDDLVKGYQEALAHYNLPVRDELVFVSSDYGEESGQQLAEQLVNGRKLPRALFVADDSIARGMLMKFNQAGVRVPQDVALIGFGDEEPAYNSFCGLTCVRQPARAKGYEAGKLLLTLVNNPEEREKEHRIILEPSLVVRKTCGC
jgi:LacI family transcriptional regulator